MLRKTRFVLQKKPEHLSSAERHKLDDELQNWLAWASRSKLALFVREAPDLRVIIDRRDLALLRADYSRELHGSLVVSTYSTAKPSKARHETGVSKRYTLTRDQGFGISHALKVLIPGPHPLPSAPAPRLEVIASGKLIPVSGDVELEVPAVFLVAVVLFSLLSIGDMVRLSSLSNGERFLQRCWQLRVGVQGCERRTLASAYKLSFLVARCSLAVAWVQLTMLGNAARVAAGLGWVQWLVVGLHLCAGLSILVTTTGAWRSVLRIPDEPSNSPKDVALYLLKVIYLLCFMFGLKEIAAAICTASQDRAVLSRALDLFGGASPASVTIATALILYVISAFYARRVRVLALERALCRAADACAFAALATRAAWRPSATAGGRHGLSEPKECDVRFCRTG